MRKSTSKHGFTLIELMIVIAIIAILASILVPNFLKARAQGVASACKANLKHIGTALEMYATDNGGTYPAALTSLTPTYMRSVPRCPAASTAYGFTKVGNYYTVYCATAGNPHSLAGCGNTGYPQFNSAGGLRSR